MSASSFTWAGKKLTPKELNGNLRTHPLPLVVKVTQVPNDYEKSCPHMANGKVLWIYKSVQEERVALKTTDNKKYISIPLEAPLKFEVVHTHDRGPPTLLSSVLRGKVQSDLKVEMSGNSGNRLSSNPDKTDAVPYGTLQIIGIYKETVLQAQSILSISGELNPLRRNISVNCPVTVDIATGLCGKSPDEFRKLKDRLKQDQSTKTANQPDTSCDIALLSGVPKSLQDVHALRHTCRLYGTASLQTSAADAVDISTQPSSTAFGEAVAKLTAKVGSDICVPQSKLRDSLFLPKSSGLKPTTQAEKHKSCYYLDARSLGTQSKPVEVIYEDQEIGGRDTAAKGKNEADKPVSKSTALGGLKDGVYIKDWKRKEAEKLAKGTVASPPAVPSPHTVPSPPAVPPPPAVPSPREVPSPPAVPSPRAVPLPRQLDEDYEVDYEIPVETDKRNNLPLPPAPSESAHKVSKKESTKSTSVFSPSEKTRTAKQLKTKSIFSGFKNKLANSVPKKGSFGAAKLTTSPQGVSPEESDGGETYETLDFGDKPEKDFKKLEFKGKKEEDSDSEENYEYPEVVYKWKTLSEVPKNIKNFTITDISLCLQLLNFGKYVKPFRERNVDGAFLRKLNKKTLMQMFQMEEFEAKQLVTFAKDNWRPKT